MSVGQTILNDLKTTGLIAGGAALVGGAIVYTRLDMLYDFEDIIAAGAAVTVIGVAGRYLVLRLSEGALREAVRRELIKPGSIRQARQRIQGLLRPQPASRKEYNHGDWMHLVAREWKPGRRRLSLPLGFNEGGKLVTTSMKGTERHLMVSGKTGTGKAVLLNQILIAAAVSGLYQIVVVSRSGKDYQLLKNMKNVHMITFSSSGDPAEDMRLYAQALPGIFKDVGVEVARRQNRLERLGYRDVDATGLRADQRPPYVIVLVEEFSDSVANIGAILGNQVKNEFLASVLSAVKIGRASGIAIWMVSQTPVGEGQIQNQIKKQCAKLTLRLDSSQDSYHATGHAQLGAETLRVQDASQNIRGESIFVGSFDTKRFEVALTDDRTLGLFARMYEGDTRFAGSPDWLSRYQPKETVLPNPDAVESPAEAENPPVQRRERILEGRTEPEPETAVSEQKTAPIFTARHVRQGVEFLLENHPDFADRTPAFTDERTVGLFLCMFGGMTRSSAIMAVFNNRNGRYNDYGALCEKHLQRLVGAFERHYGIRDAR